MEQTISIRNARLGDESALTGLFGELGFPASADEIKRRVAGMPATEVALIAEREGQVVGVATVHVTPVFHRPAPVGRITALVVTQAARGQGIGRMLVNSAERLLIERGCRIIEITSNSNRTDAHTFYRCLGFESTSLRFKKSLG